MDTTTPILPPTDSSSSIETYTGIQNYIQIYIRSELLSGWYICSSSVSQALVDSSEWKSYGFFY